MIELKEVNKTYVSGKNVVEALKNISFKIEEGEFVSVMGPSGCGKSTLINIMSGLDSAESGKLIINGKNITKMTEDELSSFRLNTIGLVFQEFHLFRMLTAKENVILPLQFLDLNNKNERGEYLLKKVGLEKRINFKVLELSAGEKQRVCIARALATDPKLILADEPTGNLDSDSSIEVMKIFQKMKKDNETILMVTHDKEMASFSDRILKMKDGILEE